MKIVNCIVKKSGIPKIEIPVRLSEIDEETLKYYLPQCISQLKQNAKKIQALEDYVDGTKQEIDNHAFLENTSGQAENRIKENHAYEIVQFKEGFISGDKKQFVNKENVNNDDITYLEKFLSDVSYYTKDLQMWHNVYATGIGTSFILPRADIFNDNGKQGLERKVVYKTENEGYDVNVNSPFVYETIDSKTNAVVYSSCIGESGLKDLFCINIANVLNKQTKRTQEVVTVYTKDSIYEYKYSNGVKSLEKIANNYFGELPMTERSVNNMRITPIEIIMDLLDAVNLLTSLDVNSVEDKVNQLLVFLGCNVKQEDIDSLYTNGILCIPPAGTSTPDVKTISNDLKYTETNTLIERILTRGFDIAGVPLASAAVSSGNNEAAYLGGGWTNASIVTNRDILYAESSEREELRKMLKVCKFNPENPVNEANANEIDIKYTVNQSNNILSKTQGMQNLYDMGVPFKYIFKTIPLFGDSELVAKETEENNAKKTAEQQKLEKEKIQATETANNGNNDMQTGDNLVGRQKQQRADQTTAEQAKGV